MINGKALAVNKHITLLTHILGVFLACLTYPLSIAATGKCLFPPNLTAFTGLGVGPKLASFEETCQKILRTISLLKPRWYSLPPINELYDEIIKNMTVSIIFLYSLLHLLTDLRGHICFQNST